MMFQHQDIMIVEAVESLRIVHPHIIVLYETIHSINIALRITNIYL